MKKILRKPINVMIPRCASVWRLAVSPIKGRICLEMKWVVAAAEPRAARNPLQAREDSAHEEDSVSSSPCRVTPRRTLALTA